MHVNVYTLVSYICTLFMHINMLPNPNIQLQYMFMCLCVCVYNAFLVAIRLLVHFYLMSFNFVRLPYNFIPYKHILFVHFLALNFILWLRFHFHFHSQSHFPFHFDLLFARWHFPLHCCCWHGQCRAALAAASAPSSSYAR